MRHTYSELKITILLVQEESSLFVNLIISLKGTFPNNIVFSFSISECAVVSCVSFYLKRLFGLLQWNFL